MATTIATLNLSSTDLLTNVLALSTTTTLSTAGKEMPTEIFGVFSENKTTIKRNK